MPVVSKQKNPLNQPGKVRADAPPVVERKFYHRIADWFAHLGGVFKRSGGRIVGSIKRLFKNIVIFEKGVPQVLSKEDEIKQNILKEEKALNYIRTVKLQKAGALTLVLLDEFKGVIKSPDLLQEWEDLKKYLENEIATDELIGKTQDPDEPIRLFVQRVQQFYKRAKEEGRKLPKGSEERKAFSSVSVKFVERMNQSKGILKLPSTDPYIQSCYSTLQNSLANLHKTVSL